eukprot:UN01400
MGKLLENSKIWELMYGHVCKSKDNWVVQIGVITSDAKSDHGPWHRGVVNVCGEANNQGNYWDGLMVDPKFEPFYFTILIPLVDITSENGPTELLIGSHHQTFDVVDLNKTHTDHVKAGTVLIFDGRMYHRGRENNR